MEEWKDLLRQDREAAEPLPAPADGGTPGRSSLMQQVRELVGQTGEAVPDDASGSVAAVERVCCPDGYMRRSPVQPYYTPPDYRRRRIWKGVLIVLAVAFAALLVAALLKSKLLSFK